MLRRGLLCHSLAASLVALPVAAQSTAGPAAESQVSVTSPRETTIGELLSASDAKVGAAARDFESGQRLFFAEKYQEALGYFRRSFSARPSPNSQLYIARCLAALGEILAAHEEYKKLIVLVSEQETPSNYAETQRAATSERAELLQQLSWVRVVVPFQPPGLTVELSGRELGAEQISRGQNGDYVYVLPGAVDVRAGAPGYPAFSQRLHLRKAQVADVAIVWAPPASPKPAPSKEPSAPSTWTNPYYSFAMLSAGVAAVGFGTWAGFSLRAHERYDALEIRCARGDCPSDEIQMGRRETTVAEVGLGVGVAGVLAGATLWVLGSQSEPPRDLDLRVGFGHAELRGRF